MDDEIKKVIEWLNSFDIELHAGIYGSPVRLNLTGNIWYWDDKESSRRWRNHVFRISNLLDEGILLKQPLGNFLLCILSCLPDNLQLKQESIEICMEQEGE